MSRTLPNKNQVTISIIKKNSVFPRPDLPIFLLIASNSSIPFLDITTPHRDTLHFPYIYHCLNVVRVQYFTDISQTVSEISKYHLSLLSLFQDPIFALWQMYKRLFLKKYLGCYWLHAVFHGLYIFSSNNID